MRHDAPRLPTFIVAAVSLGLGLGVACKSAPTDAGASRDADGLVARGAALFQQRCAVCHRPGTGSAQGPGLGGVVGRASAANGSFHYSPALRDAGLTWSEPTLDRFLTAPSALVPGTTMPVPVPDADDRRALIAYLATLTPTSSGAAAPTASAAVASETYRDDTPGKRRRIVFGELPPPFATPSSDNGPGVVGAPPGAQPRVPAGFAVTRFAADLDEPRQIRVAPNGDIFVAESAAGRVRLLRAADGASTPNVQEAFATGLTKPFGIAFYPPGPDPQWIYVANTNSVVRFPYRTGDRRATGGPETIVARITELDGGHWTRDLAFSPDGQRMYLTVGSDSNVGEDMPQRTPAETASWEAAHGVGASWGTETDRADVLVFDPSGGGRRSFANGLRNCVGLAIRPGTGEPWCSTNERDELGDNLVPDYVTHLREGAFYGWPWYYLGAHEDPRLPRARPDLAARVTAPDVLLPAHSGSLGIVFYEASGFPAEYRGDLFAAFHGSWNRAARRAPKIERVLFREGKPTGEIEDFVTGFVVDDGHVWARPVGVAVARDGALLFTEDGNGTLWRVAYAGDAGIPAPREKGKSR
jgi:glucose/arabinose dehydrogenase